MNGSRGRPSLHVAVTALRVACSAMATLHPHLLHSRPDADDARVRRWCRLAIVAAVLLAIYVGGISWVTKQLEAGVDRSIQPLPTLVHDRPGE